ncbi:hypothetical protein, partial [Legionella pneumophila]|uniref:hypothetical protein n=2 Tax=Legionella pneumophila TaxID=446 RepID=UPI00113D2B81
PISFVLVNKFDHESVCTSISFPIFVNVHFKKVTAQLNDRIPQRLRGKDDSNDQAYKQKNLHIPRIVTILKSVS